MKGKKTLKERVEKREYKLHIKTKYWCSCPMSEVDCPYLGVEEMCNYPNRKKEV